MITLMATLALGGPTTPLHPAFPLLDADGADVLVSSAPYDPSVTCGVCHDTAYIAEHASHADAGWSQLMSPGAVPGGLPWEAGVGRLGVWDADLYTVAGPSDLGAWAQTYGLDHVGGGPLAALGVQMDCLLCHLDEVNDDARRGALASGRLSLANTASLVGTGLVSLTASEDGPVTWHADAFEDGQFPVARLTLGPTRSEQCGVCHGTVYRDSAPLEHPDGRRSRATGLVYSGQRVDLSALNLVGKDGLSRSWDVHAARLLECTSCHTSPNHPASRAPNQTAPDHLRFDPRRVAVESYLRRPSHNFTVGPSATLGMTDENAMRGCEDCHDPAVGHAFLPDRGRHFEALACEACHVPSVPLTAREQLDWTALDAAGEPLERWRGMEGSPEQVSAMQLGYTPILLPREDADGRGRLAPFNVASTFLWVDGDRPVPREALAAVWADPTALAAVFDDDGDGAVSDEERRLDRPEKVAWVAEGLRAHGATAPEIMGFLDTFPVSHGVVRGETVTRECTVCHGADSRLDHGLEVAGWVPGGVTPILHGKAAALLMDAVTVDDDGALWLTPPPRAHRYVFGADHQVWVDWAGLLSALGAAGFVLVHGGLRALSSWRGGER